MHISDKCDNTIISNVVVTTEKSFVDTLCREGRSCARTIMESTQDEYSRVLLKLGACYIYFIMVDIIQTRCKKRNACGTCECRSLRDCTDISL